MQDMAQTWERPIFASGGALGYAKCFWWLIDWDWTDGIPKLRNIANTPEEISLTSGLSPTSQVITQLEAFFEALQALGVMFAPAPILSLNSKFFSPLCRPSPHAYATSTSPVVKPISFTTSLSSLLTSAILSPAPPCPSLNVIASIKPFSHSSSPKWAITATPKKAICSRPVLQ